MKVTRVAFSQETVRDAVGDIRAHREAAKVEVRRMIGRRLLPEAERKRLYTLLTRDQWTGDPLVRRWMRGDHHGPELGELLRSRSDTLKERNARRAKLRSIANQAAGRGRHGKAVVDKATMIVAEDLSRTFTGRRKLGANANRRLAAWTKGITAEALTTVSGRRGSAVRLVNAAYTSQVTPGTGFLGKRVGDRLYCPHPGRVDQDSNTAGHCRCGERNIQSPINTDQGIGSRIKA